MMTMIKLWYYAVFCFDGFTDWLISDQQVGTREVPEIPDAAGKLHRVKELHSVFASDYQVKRITARRRA